jgi:hypothetical protein
MKHLRFRIRKGRMCHLIRSCPSQVQSQVEGSRRHRKMVQQETLTTTDVTQLDENLK